MAGQTIKGSIVSEYLEKYKDLGALTLAKKIYKENKSSFDSVDNVRSVIRYQIGSKGKKDRKALKSKEFVREPRDTNPYGLFPTSAETFLPYEITSKRTLIISDLHFPYQHNKSIELALDFGKEKNVDCILINGDLLDFATISRHEKDFRARSIVEEFESVRSFLNSLRKQFPKTKIIFKEGNHDERWEKWLYLKAPEIFDDIEFRLENRLKLGQLKIDIVKDKRPVKIGKLTVLHGHELAGGSGGVNPARATFLKTLDSVIVGHYHKTSSHTETTMNGDVISVESQGCLCGMNPLYMPINKWNLGFSYVELDLKTGEYHLQNKKIVKNKIY
jgi:predicted phosphodiesterase